MGKPTNGPDWEDLRFLMKELEDTHKCSIQLELKCSGGRFSAAYFVIVSASWPDLRKPMGADGIVVQAEWPNRENRTMEGCAMRLLMLLADGLALAERPEPVK